jgi:hypothetical protein
MAVGSVRYVPDHRSFGEFILSPQIARPVIIIASKVALEAARLTPLGPGPGPHMKHQYQVSQAILAVGRRRNRRVVGKVSNDSPHAAAVEFGNSHARGQRPLGRAAAQYGEFKGSLE